VAVANTCLLVRHGRARVTRAATRAPAGKEGWLPT